MRHTLCTILFAVFGHRLCCGRIPGWTAYVGRRWQPIGDGGWNLYNVIWSASQWFMRHLEDDDTMRRLP